MRFSKRLELSIPDFNFPISDTPIDAVQVLAVVLRPHKDNKWRKYWNVYHHLIGYTTILLIVVNVITGIDILDPGNRYRIAYFAYIAFLVAVSAVLEVWMWIRWFQKRKRKSANAQFEHATS